MKRGFARGVFQARHEVRLGFHDIEPKTQIHVRAIKNIDTIRAYFKAFSYRKIALCPARDTKIVDPFSIDVPNHMDLGGGKPAPSGTFLFPAWFRKKTAMHGAFRGVEG